MIDHPESLEFNKKSSEITPQRIRVVLPGLEHELGSLSAYSISETAWADLGAFNQLAISEMDESATAAYLNKFLKLLQGGQETPSSLQHHDMFRAILTKALSI